MEEKKRVKVEIAGYSANEGTRIFSILAQEELDKIIDELDSEKIYKQTREKAVGYWFGGTAYTVLDAKDGGIYTYWLQNNNFKHPWDDFSEITLCAIDTPAADFEEQDLLDDEEMEEYEKWENYRYESIETYISEKWGSEELEKRRKNALDFWADDFEPNWGEIYNQVNSLYDKAVEEGEE